MNRFQITADIDVALLLGTLTEHQHGANKVKYAKLEELFESENVYFPSRYELEKSLDTLTGNIKHEVKACLHEYTDGARFGMYILKVHLPLNDKVSISDSGSARTFINGEFEVVLEMNVSKEEIHDIFEDVLISTANRAGLGVEYLDILYTSCLDVREIGDVSELNVTIVNK